MGLVFGYISALVVDMAFFIRVSVSCFQTIFYFVIEIWFEESTFITAMADLCRSVIYHWSQLSLLIHFGCPLLQCDVEEELPERLIGVGRLAHLQMDKAVPPLAGIWNGEIWDLERKQIFIRFPTAQQRGWNTYDEFCSTFAFHPMAFIAMVCTNQCVQKVRDVFERVINCSFGRILCKRLVAPLFCTLWNSNTGASELFRPNENYIVP